MNTRLMILGGEVGSPRKMWWISGLRVYRSGESGAAGGALASVWTVRSKTFWLKGVEEPNEASTTDTLRGLELVRSWYGRSFCVCNHKKSALEFRHMSHMTTHHVQLRLAIILDAQWE